MDCARKRSLRALNARAWNGESGLVPVSGSLDSTLKKNTAFIKRLRTAISPATVATFLAEISSLSLHKYLSEIIPACFEGLCRLKTQPESDAAVEIVSALHQRFGPADFTSHLGWHLGRGLATPDRGALKALAPDLREKEEKDRLVRQRNLLRVATDLWLVDVLRTLDDTSRPDDAVKASGKDPKPRTRARPSAEPFPLEALKDILGFDREHTHLPLLVSFVKSFGWDVLGIKSTSEAQKGPADGAPEGTAAPDPPASPDTDPPIASPDLQLLFRSVVKRYFDDVKRHVERDQKAISAQSRKNAEAYVKSGEVFEDRQASYERQLKAQERLVANAQAIADAIGAEMPNLEVSDDSLGATGSIGLVKAGEVLRSQAEGPGIWDDEQERRFYENLVDLKGKVPGVLLEDSKKKKSDTEEPVCRKVEADEPEAAKPTDDDDPSSTVSNKTTGAQVDALIVRLPELTDKDAVDQMAIDFCFLNSKASRNRLVKALQNVPKGRTDLLPCFSRLVATLGNYMSDVPKGLVDYLDSEFRSLQRRKEKDFLTPVRLDNVRYLAELTKFGIVPEHVIFHCLKVSLDDFSRMNIEVMCTLVESCGRYLLRNPDTSPRMVSFLETLQRKKSAHHLGQQERMLIENSIYYVDPPERPSIEQKVIAPTEMFIRKLIYVDLTRRNHVQVLKEIRLLHWEESDVVKVLTKVFSKPSNIQYGKIDLLALLLCSLLRYHPEFVTRIADQVVENIILGLEHNDYRASQRRVSDVRYLGELYNYRLLDHQVMFEVMYKIVTFGYPHGIPRPGYLTVFDPPDDFFRIRLIHVLLDTCGAYFNKGTVGKKLDCFLNFFQYYTFLKQPLPLDTEFMAREVFFSTRPDWQLASTVEEASQNFSQAIALEGKVNGSTQDAVVLSSSSSEDELVADGEDDSSLSENDEDMEDIEQEDSIHEEDSGPEEEAIVVTRAPEAIDPEDEADFEREYAKMMNESLESRKFERQPLFDVALPMRDRARDFAMPPAIDAASDDAGDGRAAPGTMAFTLLTKRGNRQQTREIDIPSDSHFTVAMMHQKQAEREEQQRIKTLVLSYDLRENEDLTSEAESLVLTNPNVHKGPSPGHAEAKPLNRSLVPSSDSKPAKPQGQRIRKLQLSDVDWT